jgi:hypothetical protein
MPLIPFDACRLKVKRARYHMGDLMEQIRAFLLRTPFYLEIVAGDKLGEKAWIIRVREEVPPDFSTILGDALHNLRAALDLLACELVRLNGNSDDDVAFPFARSAVHLEEVIKSKQLTRASAPAVALLKSLQPYRGGNDVLVAIHDLDILDKHRMLISTKDMVAMPDYLGGPAQRSGERVGPIRDGLKVPAPADIAPYLRVGGQSTGTLSLHFPTDAGALMDKEIIPELVRLANLVDEIIGKFTALYP